MYIDVKSILLLMFGISHPGIGSSFFENSHLKGQSIFILNNIDSLTILVSIQ